MLVGKLKFYRKLAPIRGCVIGIIGFWLALTLVGPTFFVAAKAHGHPADQPVVPTARAQQIAPELEPLAEIGLPTQDPRVIAARLIRIFLGLVGLIAVLLVIYGGYLYLTSAGEAEKVTTAKKVLINAGIGVLIIASAYGIVSFILGRLEAQLARRPGLPGVPGVPTFFGTLGGGIIESHFPARNASNIPRNTKIMITFKEVMDLSALVNDNGTPDDPLDDTINSRNVRIRRSADSAESGPFVTDARAAVTEDQKTFVFDPVELLGNANQSTSYTVFLASGIAKANGDPAFGTFGSYDWQFEVGTFVDNSPPQVESVIPLPTSTNPRNVIVQINFSEAVDPTTVSGTVAGGRFTNLSLTDNAANRLVEGIFAVSNQYRTVEFLSDNLCGTNSCGDDVYCLPGDATLTGRIRAASLGDSPPEAIFPYDGVVDVAGNSLDGDADGAAAGPPADNFDWSFSTTNEIDLEPPVIEATNPPKLTSLVELDKPIDVTFSKLMSFSSLNSNNLTISGVNYWITAANSENKTTARINHDRFSEETQYTPAVTSGVKDIFQNCFNPCIGP